MEGKQVKIPKHVGIIMDGNGRWARNRGLERLEGHRQGVDNVRTILEAAQEWGIRYLTLYAFSVENWKRPQDEVNALMDLLVDFLENQRQHLLDNQIRLHTIGREADLPVQVQEALDTARNQTAHFTQNHLVLALNYGARTEVLDAVQRYGEALLKGQTSTEPLSWEQFQQYLYTRDLPDPDLIIRTSGENRLSNFLLLQAAYAEMYFSPVCWPDFGRDQFAEAVRAYSTRERRFGLTSEQLSPNLS